MIVVHFRKTIFRTVASSIVVCSSSFFCIPILYLHRPPPHPILSFDNSASTAHMIFCGWKEKKRNFYIWQANTRQSTFPKFGVSEKLMSRRIYSAYGRKTRVGL